MRVLFFITPGEEDAMPALKKIISNKLKISFTTSKPTSAAHVVMLAESKGATAIITTSQHTLELFVGRPFNKVPSIENYMGSIIKHRSMEVLILPPLEQMYSVTYGKFLIKRFLTKLSDPQTWLKIPEFSWKLFDPADAPAIIKLMERATFISTDIETGKESDRIITCVSFTAVTVDAVNKKLSTFTVVVPFTDVYNITFIKTICGLQVPKLFQNGMYDIAYFMRFNIIVTNYLLDTYNQFHCLYAELPKRISFISAFCLRDWKFWKDMSATDDKMLYYEYNARDTFATAMIWLAISMEAPQYMWDNYKMEFPLVFPCINAGLRGFRRDAAFFDRELNRFEGLMEKRVDKLRTMVGNPHFNPRSPQQTLALFKVLGSGDMVKSDVKAMDKVKHRHPLNGLIVSEIEAYRKDGKLASSYLRNERPGQNDLAWHDRILYSVDPAGTTTGRMASKESQFWCGWNSQNIPRGRDDIRVKDGILPEEGFLFGEADYSQNEARGTAYLSGDTALIDAVDDVTKDFHGKNASRFFGMSYDAIVTSTFDVATGEWLHVPKDKPIRQLSKNVNHGSNYDMKGQALLDTMGIENVLRAKKLLMLPKHWSLLQVCNHLLACYDDTYKIVKTDWYKFCENAILNTGYLVGPTGWTRRFFGDPLRDKRIHNQAIAHPPQSLGAMQLNIAYLKVYKEVALQNPKDFILCPQIHDSILFQYRVGREDLAHKVKQAMRVPIDVTDIFGIVRTLVVPVDLKLGGTTWASTK